MESFGDGGGFVGGEVDVGGADVQADGLVGVVAVGGCRDGDSAGAYVGVGAGDGLVDGAVGEVEGVA